MPTRIRDVMAVLEAAYPPDLAEEWDTGIGLTCGDPDDPVGSVLLAVDVDAEVVSEAEQLGVQLLVTHHPLLFRPVQSVAANTAKGALIHRLTKGGIAHFAAHTNADKATGGVNDALAAALGVRDTRPLELETPAGRHIPAVSVRLGRIGELAESATLAAFLRTVAAALPATAGGVRAAGEADRPVRRVAICSGAGESAMAAAAAMGADVFVSSDLRHHVVAEFVAAPDSPAVVEVAHWAGEWPWLAAVARLLVGPDGRDAGAHPATGDRVDEPGGGLRVTVSSRRTDPWRLHEPAAANMGC